MSDRQNGQHNDSTWVTEQPSAYDPDRLYTGIDKGGGAFVSARIPARIEYEVRALIESRKIHKLRTMSDFVRDAVYHRLHYFSTSDSVDRTDNSLRLIDVAQAIVEEENTMISFRNAVQAISDVIVTLITTDNETRAVAVFQRILNAVAGTSDQYWRRKWLKKLEALADQYPSVLRGIQVTP